MAHILLISNLNCDCVIRLDNPLRSGARLSGHTVARRLGGAGANAGSALVYAGHRVSVACSVGDDTTGQWLVAEAQRHGLGLEHIARYAGATGEVLIMLAPDGERTIFFIDRRPPYRPPDAVFAHRPDCLFVNSPCAEVAELMARSLTERLVVAQMPDSSIAYWPAHVLLVSAADLPLAARADPFAFGRMMAGAALRWVVVTQGARGAVAHSASERIAVAAYPAQVVDTTGAGDVFAAGLIDALLAGRPMAAALSAAARWAAFAVESPSSTAPEGLRRYLEAKLLRQ